MDAKQVDFWIMTNSKYFEAHQLMAIREKLLSLDSSKSIFIQSIQFNDPVMMLIVSILIGHFGIDRFLIGDTGIGVAKLLTCGGMGIWTIVDWFLIMDATRQKNVEKLVYFLY